MSSIEERIKYLPKITIDVSEQFIIEVKNNGIVAGKVIGTVNKMHIGKDGAKISIDICSLNYEAMREVTRYEFSNPDKIVIE